VIAITAAQSHACALLSDGSAKCWGENGYGQLGDGNTTQYTAPVAVSGLAGATAIATSSTHTCALHSDGTVLCWGDDTYGELGNRNLSSIPVTSPVTVAGLSGASAITVGDNHSCAVLSDGNVTCWGRNNAGQVGRGATAPVAVTGLSGASSITAGGDHTCVLLSGGTIECWGGTGGDGVLGNGAAAGSLSPVAVSNLTGVAALGMGSGAFHACAVLSDGTTACWGNNTAGQLGNGYVGVQQGINGTLAKNYTPAVVPNLTGVTAIAVAPLTTCALQPGGAVQCWGDNSGAGTNNSSHTGVTSPTISSLTGATAVVAGDAPAGYTAHTCALLAGGTATCVGTNNDGELGNGTTTFTQTPTPVLNLTGATEISTGSGHTCAVVSGGAVECWGDNLSGDLGNGNTTQYTIPVAVAGLTGATSVTAGSSHTCALLTGGTAVCWGDNSKGQLGVGTMKASSSPLKKRPRGDRRITAVWIGWRHVDGAS
jgi:alpha-tubulin suppressor-like RCC1 family protein